MLCYYRSCACEDGIIYLLYILFIIKQNTILKYVSKKDTLFQDNVQFYTSIWFMDYFLQLQALQQTVETIQEMLWKLFSVNIDHMFLRIELDPFYPIVNEEHH